MKPSAEAAYENLDRLSCLELQGAALPHGVKTGLYEAAREAEGRPLTLAAAELLDRPPAHIGIVTGAAVPDHMPAGENDGPLGAVVLARAPRGPGASGELLYRSAGRAADRGAGGALRPRRADRASRPARHRAAGGHRGGAGYGGGRGAPRRQSARQSLRRHGHAAPSLPGECGPPVPSNDRGGQADARRRPTAATRSASAGSTTRSAHGCRRST